MSVTGYAVVHIGVKHIIICGYTNCGACNGVPSHTKFGLLDTWLHPLRNSRPQNGLAPTDSEKSAELSVRLSVETVRENANAMAVENSVDVRGFMYDLATGCLGDLNVQPDAAEWQIREERIPSDKRNWRWETAAIGSKVP